LTINNLQDIFRVTTVCPQGGFFVASPLFQARKKWYCRVSSPAEKMFFKDSILYFRKVLTDIAKKNGHC